MQCQIKKPSKSTTESDSSPTLNGKVPKKGDFAVVEVVYLKDMPLLERQKEASKPLYLARYE
jgi:hypothetical protein